MLLKAQTEPPLTVSIEGEWGSGKSSFMLQLRDQLGVPGRRDRGGRVLSVWFNPWRHDKEEELWAAFAVRFVSEVSGQLPLNRRLSAHLRLLVMRFSWRDGWPENEARVVDARR